MLNKKMLQKRGEEFLCAFCIALIRQIPWFKNEAPNEPKPLASDFSFTTTRERWDYTMQHCG